MDLVVDQLVSVSVMRIKVLYAMLHAYYITIAAFNDQFQILISSLYLLHYQVLSYSYSLSLLFLT